MYPSKGMVFSVEKYNEIDVIMCDDRNGLKNDTSLFMTIESEIKINDRT